MKTKPIKPIFILWFQGWGNAPAVVKHCVRSWRRMNPGWQVVLLDCHTLPAWVEWRRDIPDVADKKITKPGASDIIRMALLRKFGGVWADATLFCAKPLDQWLPKDPFFAFDNQDRSKYVSSWFLSADHDSRMLEIWQQAIFDYWDGRTRAHNYFWVHRLFASLVRNDEEFRSLWQGTTKIDALGPHYFHRVGFQGDVTDEIKEHVDNTRSPVYKLTWKKGPIQNTDRLQYLFQHHFGD